jgi:polar amino acid transport system substrate-binding protein
VREHLRFALIAAILFSWAAIPAMARPLVVNSAWSWPISSPRWDGLFDRLVIEACRRVGVEVELQAMPAERSLRNVEAGRDDADGPRIAGLDRIYPHLVRVPEPLMVYEFVAFVTTASPETGGWDSLDPYAVGIVRGWKILEGSLAGVKSLHAVRTANLLLRMLARGRVDVAVYERRMGLALAERMGLAGVCVVEPPLTTQPMFLYVNERHRHLVPKLAGALREMREDGTTARIEAEVLGAPELEVP